MNWVGIIVGVFLIAGVIIVVFTDWQATRNPHTLTFEEHMDALKSAGREAERYRRNRQ